MNILVIIGGGILLLVIVVIRFGRNESLQNVTAGATVVF